MHHRQNSGAHALAQGLGWFSIGLGLAELIAPRALGRALGMEQHSSLIQAFGAREIAAGIGILASRDPTPWVWGRVGGDALDIAALTPALSEDNPQRGNAAMALAAVAGATLLDILCAAALSRQDEDEPPMRDYSNRSGFPKGRNFRALASSDSEDLAAAEAQPS